MPLFHEGYFLFVKNDGKVLYRQTLLSLFLLFSYGFLAFVLFDI